MGEMDFEPKQVFDQKKHIVDRVALRYLEKTMNDVRNLIPVKVAADGNCLYHSILLLMDNLTVTISELRGEYFPVLHI